MSVKEFAEEIIKKKDDEIEYIKKSLNNRTFENIAN